MRVEETTPTNEATCELTVLQSGGLAQAVLVISDESLVQALAQVTTVLGITVEIVALPSPTAFHYYDVDELVETPTPAEEPIPPIVWPESSRFSDLYALPNIDMECKPVPLWQHLNQPGNKVHKGAPGGPRSRQSGTSHRRHR